MADILIHGMEMPHDCDECKLCAFIPVGDYAITRTCMPLRRVAEITIRRKDCPLVELQEHGDLVSKQYLIAEYDAKHKGETGMARRIIEDAPVIVPSNKEGSE